MQITTLLITLTISILWAIPPITEKYLGAIISSPTIFVGLTIFYTFISLTVFFFNKKQVLTDLPKFNKTVIILLLFTTLVGAAIPNYIFINMLKDNKSSVITAISYTSPVFVFIFGYLFLKERLNIKVIIGIIFTIIGTMMIALYDHVLPEEPFL